MPMSFDALLASRDWYPDISGEGEVSGALRFVDLDAPVPEDVSSLNSRVCVVIGITQRATTAPALSAGHLDLILSTAPSDDSAVVTVPDIEEAISLLTAAVDGAPRAALVIAALLRQTTVLPVAEAIAAEAAAYSTLLAGPEFARWLESRSARKATPSSESARVEATLEAGVVNVRMTRKLRLNAMDSAMRAALVEAFGIAIAAPELQLRLTGEGPCFSNGGDLREFGTAPDPATAWAVRVTQHPGWQLSQLADRAHVHMHGPCIGAGVEIAAFAGSVSADPATTFLLPELQMGLLPGAGGCVSIPRRIGRWRTLWLVLSGSTLTAAQALEWGLIDDIAAID